MAAPLYTSSAPLLQAGGVSGSSALTTAPGAHAAAAPVLPTGKTVNVVSPDGSTYGLDEAFLERALAEGYKVESAEQAGMRRFLEANKGLGGDARVAIANLADEATFGVSGAIGRKILEKSADPYALAKWEALKADHDVANALGGVAGFGASLALGTELFGAAGKIGGGVARRVLGHAATDAIEHAAGKAVAAEMAYRAPSITAAEAAKVGPGLARKILAASADMGTQGLVLSSPKALTEAMLGDPERAAQTWIYGGTGGAALGLAGGAIGGLAGRAGAALSGGGGLMGKARSWAEGAADKQAFRSIASNEASLGKVLKDLELQFGDDAADKVGRYMRDNGLLKPFRESARDGAKRFGRNVEAEGKSVGKFWDDITKSFGDEGRVNAADLIAKIKEKALTPLTEENFGMEGLADSLSKKLDSLEKLMARRADKNGTIGLNDAHDLQRLFDGHIKFSALNTAEQETINTVMADARRALHDELVAKVQAIGGDAAANKLKELNQRFSIAKAIAKGAKDYVKREGKNRVFSPTDYGSGFAGALLGALTGGSLPIGLLSGPAMAYGHHILRTEGNALAARALGSVAEGRGLVALEAAHANQGEALDRIPQALDALGSGRKWSDTARTQSVNILTHMLGVHEDDVRDHKSVMVLADRLASLTASPAEMQKHIEAAIAPIHGDAPEVAESVAMQLPAIVGYLAGAAPKAPTTQSPFEPKTVWKPSGAEVAAFRAKVETALNPHKAIDALANGTLTAAHIEALQAVAPRIYDEMKRKIVEYGASGKAKPLPYSARLKLSMLTGVPLDRSIAQIAGYQEVFAMKPEPAEPRPVKIKPPEMTDAARLSNT